MNEADLHGAAPDHATRREIEAYVPNPPPAAPASPFPAPEIPAERVLFKEAIPGGSYWGGRVARHQTLRIENAAATPGVTLLLYDADNPSDRLNLPDTIKVQWTAALRKGMVLLSDMGRVCAAVVEDSCGRHDALTGGSTDASCRAAYGGDHYRRNARDNFLLALGKAGLSKRDLTAPLTLFGTVDVDGEGGLGFAAGATRPGDYVELRAELNLLAFVSNTPHPLAPHYEPRAIRVTIWDSGPPPPDDFCRNATPEAVRAFDNTDRLFVPAYRNRG